MIGIIAYSFAWRRNGHSPCNQRLALATRRISSQLGQPYTIVAQRTIANILRGMSIPCEAIERRPGYEGSEEVTNQADLLFKRFGIDTVIPVAQPVFQLTKCLHLVRAKGYTTPTFIELCRMIGWIGFDPESVQPQTLSLGHLIYYTGKQVLTGYRPPVKQSEP